MSLSRYVIRAVLSASFSGLAVAGLGCADSGRGAVPNDAEKLGQGRGDLVATAARNGTVWVVDDTDNKLIWEGEANREDRIAIDTEGNRVTRNGKTVAERNLKPDHKYVIYYRR